MFASLGRYLENRAKGKTNTVLTDLMSLTPLMATIYTDAPDCMQEKRITTESVQVRDTVKLVPGEKVPADGTIIRGSSTVDESAVTGEPLHSDPERTNSGSFTLGNLPAHTAGGRGQILNCSFGWSHVVNYNSCYSGTWFSYYFTYDVG